jgi:hypothetical protein
MDDFVEFPKIPRFAREVIVTEKIDGTNAQIDIGEDGTIRYGSRNGWLKAGADNHGFRGWGEANADELAKLGPGRHYGEWWGAGVNRGYGLKERRFSLFNVGRWADDAARPACCHVVPVLWRGNFRDLDTDALLEALRTGGSVAEPGYMNPEGIIIFHVAGNVGFKRTIHRDEEPKGLARRS